MAESAGYVVVILGVAVLAVAIWNLWAAFRSDGDD